MFAPEPTTASLRTPVSARYRLWQIQAVAALLACASPSAQRVSPLAGTWEYRQPNAAGPAGVDAEGERLVISFGPDGRPAAQYFGLERAGEHGLFYTAVDAAPVDVGPPESLTLVVPARKLYRTRPTSVEEAATLPSAGMTRYELSLRGTLVNGALVLACSAVVVDTCPDSEMTFRRISK